MTDSFFTFFLHRKTVVFFIPKNSYNISIIIEENILQRRICHVQYYQKSSYGVPEKTYAPETFKQNHDQRPDHRLRNQPHGLLLSFQGHL